MIEQGRNIKMEKQNKIAQIKLELESAEAIKADRESLKEAAEAPESQALEKYRDAEDAKKVAEKAVASAKNEAEAKEVFDSLDGDSDGRLTKEEIQADDTYDTNRDGTVSEEEAGESNADAASEHSSPPLDDDLASPETDESAEDYDPELDDEQTEEDDEDDLDEDEDTADDDGSQHQSLEVVYDEHTQTLVDAANVARSSFQEAADRVKELNRELMEGQESLEKDYGPEDEFRVFEGNCYEYTDREYNYKLCPFDKASQSAKSGGGETSLGKWGEWQDNYRSMKYSNGQGCWNGPNRSTTVRLECGIENLLVSATEPNKCEYHFVFMTPAVCEGNEPPTLQQQGQQEEVEGQEERVADAHTEL
uniref:Glucosidase 2 subunit beta-like n=2 Tax=Hirondellea gigas TaxID=1518452 RepID=A0A2P2HXH4_9CRUS